MSIAIENVEVIGWKHAIRGMRSPLNSWDRCDSGYGCDEKLCKDCGFKPNWCGNTPKTVIGPNDYDLMMRLAKGGPVHAKYRRMITVYMDITAPLYMLKELDTYRVGVACNSCSTMHRIHAKEFTLEDFSHEHLLDDWNETSDYGSYGGLFSAPAKRILESYIEVLNFYRNKYLETKDKKYWWQMIQLLPSSYNQRRTYMLSYEVLHNIYISRKNHKLTEWRELCSWIETLPYSELITMEESSCS